MRSRSYKLLISHCVIVLFLRGQLESGELDCQGARTLLEPSHF